MATPRLVNAHVWSTLRVMRDQTHALSKSSRRFAVAQAMFALEDYEDRVKTLEHEVERLSEILDKWTKDANLATGRIHKFTSRGFLGRIWSAARRRV